MLLDASNKVFLGKSFACWELKVLVDLENVWIHGTFLSNIKFKSHVFSSPSDAQVIGVKVQVELSVMMLSRHQICDLSPNFCKWLNQCNVLNE